MFLKTAMWGVLLLGIVIFVHELGHFLAAKWRGVRVLRFSLGFGPALFSFRRGETEYRISWFPLGGYVQMAGDAPLDDGSMPERTDEFLSHPWHGRIAIAAAGPAANLVTAFLVLVAVGLVGVGYPDFESKLGPVADTTLAFGAGLREGDRVVAVGETPVTSWWGMYEALSDGDGAVSLVVERGGERLSVPVPAEQREDFLAGLRRPPDPPVVGAVVTGMPAYKAGLKAGDRIVAVNRQAIDEWNDLPVALTGQIDQPVLLRVQRGEREFEVTVTPIDPQGRGGERGQIGIEAPRHGVFVVRYSFVDAVRAGFWATGSVIQSVYGGMWLTLSRPLYYREYLGGPLFIAQAAGEQARRGFDMWLQFLAMINVAIMAFNLLPLPLLDGGHITLALLQAIRRRAISGRAYVRFQQTGLVVIGALFIFILANDPLRLIQRQQAIGQTQQAAPPEETIAPNPP